jgi:hypothetical protein
MIAAAPRRHPVRARRWALPIHREEATTNRRSEPAKPEYQNVRPSAAAGGGARPGLRSRASTIMTMTMRRMTSELWSAMFEAVWSLAVASGVWTTGGLPFTDPIPGSVLGAMVPPGFGANGVTLEGTVTAGLAATRVPPSASREIPPAPAEVEG